ncbi:MAG: glycosyltransferase family 2 protein [Pseudomonadota bacterium]
MALTGGPVLSVDQDEAVEFSYAWFQLWTLSAINPERKRDCRRDIVTDGDETATPAAFFGRISSGIDAIDRDDQVPSTSERDLEVSVVTPMYNEEGGAEALITEIATALDGIAHEILAVDDASTDGTQGALKSARQQFPQLRILRHGENAGQSRAIRTGVLAARGKVIATLDGDGQNNPADFPRLLERLAAEQGPAGEPTAMVAGERQKRQDTAAKKWASRIANGVRSKVLNDGAADTGCGLKVFLRDAYLRLPYFDHSHRYLPALMVREGFSVVFEPVSHRARAHGASKYTNLGRLAVAFRDLLGVMWLNHRARSPKNIYEVQCGQSCDKIPKSNRARGLEDL